MNIILDDGAFAPEKAHETDAGFDIRTPRDVIVPPTICRGDTNYVFIGCAVIDTGVHVEIPRGYVGMLKSKSGLNVKHNIIGEGVVDAGYTGSIVVKLYNLNNTEYRFRRGDKIIQLVVAPISEDSSITVVDKFEETERANNGFGSSGR